MIRCRINTERVVLQMFFLLSYNCICYWHDIGKIEVNRKEIQDYDIIAEGI